MKKLAFLFLFLLFILSSCSVVYENKLEDLEVQYEDLQNRYEDLSFRVGSVEDDIATVYCFFEDEPDVTEQEAYDAFMRIRKALDY